MTEDHAVVRQGLKLILADHFPQAVFGEARNAHRGIDPRLEGEMGCGGAGHHDAGPQRAGGVEGDQTVPPAIAGADLEHASRRSICRASLKAGAAGYLTKESAGEELVGAIRKVVAGGRYISPSLAERMASYLTVDVQKAPHERLSDREFLILRMIASGKPVSQIAKELSLSVSTVSTYRARILGKMDMKNNAELTHYALQKAWCADWRKPL